MTLQGNSGGNGMESHFHSFGNELPWQGMDILCFGSFPFLRLAMNSHEKECLFYALVD